MRRTVIDAELTVAYGGTPAARSVLHSLEPDNKFALKGMHVKGEVRGKKIIITIHCERGIPSLINTLEDIFACLGVSEDGLSSLRGIRRSSLRARTENRRRQGERR